MVFASITNPILMGLRRIGLVALWGVLLAGCAAGQTFMGIDLRPGSAAPDTLQGLARNAHLGDKQAQLQLGLAFEQGVGVPRDISKAKALYRAAARPSGGPMWVYLPPPGPGLSGRVVQVGNQPVRPGLAEARARLERLKDRR